MNAEIIAVGTEILLGQIANSHAQFLSENLAGLGVSVYFHTSVGDNKKRVSDLVQTALQRSDVVLLTGGLGPTEDDLTRDAVAEACHLPLVFSQDAFDQYVAPYFKRVGKMGAVTNRRQAQRIGDAEFLPNLRGTAPGQYLRVGDKHLFLLPGPPLEMRPMYMEQVRPRLQKLYGDQMICSRVLRLYGIGESDAEFQIQDLMQAQSNPTIAPLASEGEMVFRLTAHADTEAAARQLIVPLEEAVLARLGRYVYGFDEDSLARVVVNHLIRAGQQVAFAESCTGGLLTSMVVDIAGSSKCLLGGVIAYDNRVKIGSLSVSEASLKRDGAVSEQVAREMACGVKERMQADFGVSVTGIAGPDGGTEEKPVGTTFIAVAGLDSVWVEQRTFAGDRAQVRMRAAKMALHMLNERLIGR